MRRPKLKAAQVHLNPGWKFIKNYQDTSQSEANIIPDGVIPDFNSEIYTEPIVPFPIFVESKEYLNWFPFSNKQYELVYRVLGSEPERILERGYHSIREGVAMWGKGSGKDTVAATLILYLVYILLCMKDPHGYLRCPDTIALINVAYSEKQARRIYFKYFTTRLKNCQWFLKRFKMVDGRKLVKHCNKTSAQEVNIKSDEVEFPNDIVAYSYHSASSGYEGYNTLFWIMDEACLPYHQSVVVEGGKKIQIGKIVEQKLPVKVLSYNVKNGKLEYKKITNWFKYPYKQNTNKEDMLELRLNHRANHKAKYIRCTANHKIYNADMELVRADSLSVGDGVYARGKFYSEDFKIMPIKSIGLAKDRYQNISSVYDIEVQGNHNYFAGDILISNSAFKDDTKTANATDVYSTLRTSANTRFPGVYKGIIISWPRSKTNDFTLDKYNEAMEGKRPYLWGTKACTWEVHPYRMMEDFEEDRKVDPEEYRTKYMCDPPTVQDAFLQYPEKLYEVTYERPCVIKTQDIVLVAEVFNPDKKRVETKRSIGKEIMKVNYQGPHDRDRPRVVHVDLGRVEEGAAVSMGYAEPVEVNEIIRDVDGMPLLNPNALGILDAQTVVREMVYIDFIEYWIPKKGEGLKVNILNVENFVIRLTELFNVVKVSYDQWNSASAIDSLNRKGVFTDEHNVNLKDYKDWRRRIYSGLINRRKNARAEWEAESLIWTSKTRVDHAEKACNDGIQAEIGVVRLLTDVKSNKQRSIRRFPMSFAHNAKTSSVGSSSGVRNDQESPEGFASTAFSTKVY